MVGFFWFVCCRRDRPDKTAYKYHIRAVCVGRVSACVATALAAKFQLNSLISVRNWSYDRAFQVFRAAGALMLMLLLLFVFARICQQPFSACARRNLVLGVVAGWLHHRSIAARATE